MDGNVSAPLIDEEHDSGMGKNRLVPMISSAPTCVPRGVKPLKIFSASLGEESEYCAPTTLAMANARLIIGLTKT